MFIYEVAWSLHLQPKDLDAFFTLKGRANIRAAIRKGKGYWFSPVTSATGS